MNPLTRGKAPSCMSKRWKWTPLREALPLKYNKSVHRFSKLFEPTGSGTLKFYCEIAQLYEAKPSKHRISRKMKILQGKDDNVPMKQNFLDFSANSMFERYCIGNCAVAQQNFRVPNTVGSRSLQSEPYFSYIWRIEILAVVFIFTVHTYGSDPSLISLLRKMWTRTFRMLNLEPLLQSS